MSFSTSYLFIIYSIRIRQDLILLDKLEVFFRIKRIVKRLLHLDLLLRLPAVHPGLSLCLCESGQVQW